VESVGSLDGLHAANGDSFSTEYGPDGLLGDASLGRIREVDLENVAIEIHASEGR